MAFTLMFGFADAALKTKRPMRPKPLMPRVAMLRRRHYTQNRKTSVQSFAGRVVIASRHVSYAHQMVNCLPCCLVQTKQALNSERNHVKNYGSKAAEKLKNPS